MIEVPYKESPDCVSAFIKGVKHSGFNPRRECFSFSAFNAGQLESIKRMKKLNVTVESIKHIKKRQPWCPGWFFVTPRSVKRSSKAIAKTLPAGFSLFVCISGALVRGHFWGACDSSKRKRKRRKERITASLSTGGNHFTCQPLPMSSFILQPEGPWKPYNSIHRHPDVPPVSVCHVLFLSFYFALINDGRRCVWYWETVSIQHFLW